MLESNLALIKRDEDIYDDTVDAERQRDLLSLVRICYVRLSLRICAKAPPLPVGLSRIFYIFPFWITTATFVVVMMMVMTMMVTMALVRIRKIWASCIVLHLGMRANDDGWLNRFKSISLSPVLMSSYKWMDQQVDRKIDCDFLDWNQWEKWIFLLA